MTAGGATSQRIVARLLDMGFDNLPLDARIQRTHAGIHQRNEGAMSWLLWSDTRGGDLRIGSFIPATELLRCRDWKITPPGSRNGGDTEIDPCNACEEKRIASRVAATHLGNSGVAS